MKINLRLGGLAAAGFASRFTSSHFDGCGGLDLKVEKVWVLEVS